MGIAERMNPRSLVNQATTGVNKFGVYDHFMREVQEGDIVFLPGKQDTFWRISKIAPVLRPDAPPGLMEVTLVAAFVTGLPGGAPIMDMIRLRTRAEVEGSLPAAPPPAPPAEPPTVEEP